MVSRRGFLRNATAAMAGAGAVLPSSLRAAAEQTDRMKIQRIEAVTFRNDIRVGGGSGGSDGAEFMWVRLHTDSGLIGTGETYPFHQGEVGALKDYSRILLGQERAR